jgi:hypothetical protein
MLRRETSAKRSPAEELRSSLLQKGDDAFLSVVGRNDPGESGFLNGETIVYCGVHPDRVPEQANADVRP